VGNEFFEMSRV